MLSGRIMKIAICNGADCLISARGGGTEEGYQLNLVRFFKISLSDKNMYKNYGWVRKCDGCYVLENKMRNIALEK